MSVCLDQPAYPLPNYALRVLCALESQGYEAWVVGGWVRDALLAAPSHDIDITCSAPWQKTESILQNQGIVVHRTGVAHGTVTAVVDGHPIEITTFRTEGSYTDHRHPDLVQFVDSVQEDLARRDLTVNALAYHPQRGLLDLFGGAQDLAHGVIRAVGEPDRRFDEDALRVLRTLRFACRLGFYIEPATDAALRRHVADLSTIAQERIGQEMDGIVRTGKIAWALEYYPELMCAALPELEPMYGLDQHSPYHIYDVMEHTIHVCRAVEEFSGSRASQELRWAALLHDVAKPVTLTVDERGRGHFFGHPKVGARMAASILQRLALPGELVSAVKTLVRLHDHAVTPSPRSVRRTLLKFENAFPGHARELTFALLDLKRADAVSKSAFAAGYTAEVDRMAKTLRTVIAEGGVYRLRDLSVSGADVIERVGIAPGPVVGMILNEMLSQVVNGDLPNDRDVLLSALKSV